MSESKEIPKMTLGAALDSVQVTPTDAAVFLEMLARSMQTNHESLRDALFAGAAALAYAPPDPPIAKTDDDDEASAESSKSYSSTQTF